MSLHTKALYEFESFCLNPSEKVLLRDGAPVPLTPKVFDTLQILVENAGHLLEKEELMKKIWEDRFVEDSNLTFNIKTLRKALGDHAANPRFIETVPRRGYRFIAPVKERVDKIVSNKEEQTNLKPIEEKYENPSKFRWLPLASVAIFAVILSITWYFGKNYVAPALPLLSSPFASEKLSTSGKVFSAAISPDGKTVVYTVRNDATQSVWLREIETGNNIEIIPPSDDVYYVFAFSPKGDFLYFTRQPKDSGSHAGIYRISIHGGIPVQIVDETQGWIGVSPDGEKLSFVRCYYLEKEFCSLWIADSRDGQSEKKLASYPRPFRIADNKFSPDGNAIVYAVGQSENQANDFGVMAYDLKNGIEREFTKEKFFNIKHLTWLPDSSGLLLTAARFPNKHFRIWRLSAASGEAHPLTRDSESYSVLSLDREALALVSTQIKQDFQLLLFSIDASPAAFRVLVNASWASFAPDGRILFSSIATGNEEIWSINADGGGQRQLTNDGADDSKPIVSPADGSIFFSSNRDGEAEIWRMNADGSNQKKITRKDGGFPISVSPDGEWVYYQHGLERTLWRVSSEGGHGKVVLHKRKYLFAISPDASMAAFSERQGDETVLMIASLADGQTLKAFPLPDRQARLLNITWHPDGKSLAYTLLSTQTENNTLWLQSLEDREPKKIVDLGEKEIQSLSFSPDGRTIALVQGSWKHDAILLRGLK